MQKTVSFRNTPFINMENLEGNKREKKIPFCLFAQRRLGKKAINLNRNQKRFSCFKEKVNKTLNIYPTGQTICIYVL